MWWGSFPTLDAPPQGWPRRRAVLVLRTLWALLPVGHVGGKKLWEAGRLVWGSTSPGRAALGSALWDKGGEIALRGALGYLIKPKALIGPFLWSEAEISKFKLERRCLFVITRVTG